MKTKGELEARLNAFISFAEAATDEEYACVACLLVPRSLRPLA
jgi:hypothetical protein